jgi:hypothetical protein
MAALTSCLQKMKILNWLELMDSAVEKIGQLKVGKLVAFLQMLLKIIHVSNHFKLKLLIFAQFSKWALPFLDQLTYFIKPTHLLISEKTSHLLSVPNRRACTIINFGGKSLPLHDLIWTYTFINFEEFFPPTCLFHPTRLLILRIFSHIHVYSTLHIY